MTQTALIGDIGGTHCRLARVENGAVRDVRVYATAQFPGMGDALAAYTRDVPGPAPDAIILAAAGPVHGDTIRMTNAPWYIDADDVRRQHPECNVRLLNDFDALAQGLPFLPADALIPVGPSFDPVRDAPRIVVGPGTGLGSAALIRAQGRNIAIPCEAQHAPFPINAADPMEAAVAAWIMKTHALPFISAEDMCSGPGLMRLYRAVCAINGAHSDECGTADIIKRADAGEQHALNAVNLMLTALGRFAGGLALTFLAQGGVYLAGGMTGALAHHIGSPVFRRAFDMNGAFDGYTSRLPVYRIAHDHPGLYGCAAYLNNKAG